MHDSSKVLMGAIQSSFKVVESYVGSIPAGKLVHLKSDGTISIAKADGSVLGISLGVDLSNTNKTAVCRAGLRVPLLVTAEFEPTLGAQVTIDDVTGLAKAAGSGVTAMNGVFASTVKASLNEDGTETAANVVLVDMQGGL